MQTLSVQSERCPELLHCTGASQHVPFNGREFTLKGSTVCGPIMCAYCMDKFECEMASLKGEWNLHLLHSGQDKNGSSLSNTR